MIDGIRTRSSQPPAQKKRRSLFAVSSQRHAAAWKFVAIISIIALITAITYPLFAQLNSSQKIDKSRYQAIYLISGQVYFGKLSSTQSEFIVMTSPYTTQSVPAASSDDTAKTTTNAQATLIRVKEQTLGPDDSIAFNKDQVLFWQNLRDDSKVVQAIKGKQ